MPLIIYALTIFLSLRSAVGKTGKLFNFSGGGNLFKYSIAGIASYLGYQYLKKSQAEAASANIQSSKAQQVINNTVLPNSTSDELATRFAGALNLKKYSVIIFGNPWTLVPGFTNETEVFTLATEMSKAKNYSSVFASYDTMYDRNLTDDIKEKLTPDEYKKFTQLLNGMILTGGVTPKSQGGTTPNTLPSKPAQSLPSTQPSSTAIIVSGPNANANTNQYVKSLVNGLNVRATNAPYKTILQVQKGVVIGRYFPQKNGTATINGISRKMYAVSVIQNGKSVYAYVVNDPNYTKIVTQ